MRILSENTKKYKMDKLIRKYCTLFVKEKYPSEADEICRKANVFYQEFCNDAPDIAPGKNIMAGNLYQFLTFLAYYEASGRIITEEDIRSVVGRILDDYKIAGRFINMNSQFICRLFYGIVRPYAAKVQKMKAKGLWGNTWDILVNPENHDIGFSIHLIGCPLSDFAKAHGYEDILPVMCSIDHDVAALMHARLIRNHTIASGAGSCDYWYVGDKTI